MERVDDQADGVEGVGEHLEERQVPGPGRGLVGHENDHRLAFALHEAHFGDARSHALDVTGEGVGQHVLTGPIELHAFGQFGEVQKSIPGKLVDLDVVFAVVVGHDQLHVVADMEDLTVH